MGGYWQCKYVASDLAIGCIQKEGQSYFKRRYIFTRSYMLLCSSVNGSLFGSDYKPLAASDRLKRNHELAKMGIYKGLIKGTIVAFYLETLETHDSHGPMRSYLCRFSEEELET
jgi:hypothetical protein